MYRLFTDLKGEVSIGFIIPSYEVVRLINAIETVLRYVVNLCNCTNNQKSIIVHA